MNRLTSEKWWGASATRAVKTAAQTAAALLMVDAATSDLWTADWKSIVGKVLMAMLLSMLMSLKGLPEVSDEREE
jgi:hypothetical protein